VIDEILSIQEDTEYNSDTCLILADRVDVVSPANHAFNCAFVKFHKVLVDIREFIKDISQLNGLHREREQRILVEDVLKTQK
ncbi:4194_t:CDS:2, partial [Acaulospora morrowiae]